jgi:CRP-like cAMP-binding protein
MRSSRERVRVTVCVGFGRHMSSTTIAPTSHRPHPLVIAAGLAVAGAGALYGLHRRRFELGCGRDAPTRRRPSATGTSPAPVTDEEDNAPQGAEGRALRDHLERFSLRDPDGNDTPGLFASTATRPFEEPDRVEAAPPPVRYRNTRRSTVSGPSTNLAETRSYRPQAYPKSEEQEANLRRALRTCQLFSQLDDDELGLVAAAMPLVTFVRGVCITRQGDTMDREMERFMIIASGEVAVIKDGTVLRVLRAWQYFNERHLMFVHASCRLTHRVETSQCECYALSADDYRHIVTRVAVDKSELYEGFLDRVTWLNGLTHREKLQLADMLQPVVYNDGDYLIEYDTVGEWLYLIVEGTVEVHGRKDGEIVPVCQFGPGDFVGELEFINNHRTVADVRAKGRVKAARLHRDHFEMCMGPIVDVFRRSSAADERFAYYRAVVDELDRTGRHPA